MIIVAGVGGANPHFIIAPNTLSEKMACINPDILHGGEAMSCTQPMEDGSEGNMETVTVGVVGGQFCGALRTLGPFIKVISPAECTHDDCACFMVEHYWVLGSDAAEAYRNAVRGERSDELEVILFGPPFTRYRQRRFTLVTKRRLTDVVGEITHVHKTDSVQRGFRLLA